MSILLIEQFVAHPDWSRVPPHRLARALELVSLIQAHQAHQEQSRQQQQEDYYEWLLELERILHE